MASAESSRTIDCDSLSEFTMRLRDSGFRSSFSDSPGKALQSAGLVERLPSEFVEAVGRLSADELARVAEIVEVLEGFEPRGRPTRGPCWF